MAPTRPYSSQSGSEKLIPSPGFTSDSSTYSPYTRADQFPDNGPLTGNSMNSGFQSIHEYEEKDRVCPFSFQYPTSSLSGLNGRTGEFGRDGADDMRSFRSTNAASVSSA